MLKIYQEVTEWKGITYRQPNHVYLMDGDRVYAYSKWGEHAPSYMKTALRIDKRGRKFVEVKKDSWGFDLDVVTVKIEKPLGKSWQIAGSKGNTYTVSLADEHWNCTCPGFTFRGSCKHVEKQKETV